MRKLKSLPTMVANVIQVFFRLGYAATASGFGWMK